MKRKRDPVRLCPCPGETARLPMVTFDPEDPYYASRDRGRRDPKRKPLIEKRYRVMFVHDDEFYSVYEKAHDEAEALLKAERRFLPAGRKIGGKWLKGYGWTPQVFED